MQATLDKFAARATIELGVTTHCSLILRTPSSADQVASNDFRAAACDQLEARDGRGPCITAIEQLSSVVVDDLETDRRWPEWNQAARSFGFRAFIALPGYVDEGTTVALNAYSEEPTSWQRPQIIRLDQYVQQLAATLHRPHGWQA